MWTVISSVATKSLMFEKVGACDNEDGLQDHKVRVAEGTVVPNPVVPRPVTKEKCSVYPSQECEKPIWQQAAPCTMHGHTMMWEASVAILAQVEGVWFEVDLFAC